MLPEMLILDVGDTIHRLRHAVADSQGITVILNDTPEHPSNVEIDDFIETVVDSISSPVDTVHRFTSILDLSFDLDNGSMSPTHAALHDMGMSLINQLKSLRVFEMEKQFNYFYAGRGDDWISLARKFV